MSKVKTPTVPLTPERLFDNLTLMGDTRKRKDLFTKMLISALADSTFVAQINDSVCDQLYNTFQIFDYIEQAEESTINS